MYRLILLKTSNIIASELFIIIGMFLLFVFIFLVIVNSWNKVKYNYILDEKDELKKGFSILEKKLKKTYKENRKLKSKNKELLESRKTFVEKINNFDEKLRYKEVQANNSRLGAHFLKNVLGRIQEDYKNQTLGKFDFFGKTVVVEKKDKKKLLSLEILVKLNALLDYFVYTTNEKYIDINDEVSHLKIFLEIINYVYPNLKINHNFRIKYENENMIFPTLMFPFIENAFKHGDLNNDDSFINIDFNIVNNVLLYQVTNSSINIKEKENKQGFGLKSLEQNMKTIYKNPFMECYEKENYYISNLNINL